MEIYSVSGINAYIKTRFEQDGVLARVMINGELSNFKRHYSGHCYFTLKDKNAAIKGVMFKSRAQLLRFCPSDGQKVIAGGRITVFERDGQYQLYVDTLLPDGAGELNLAYEQLKKQLSAQGLFNEEFKRPLPKLPERIGIVTSATGAVLRDIFKVAKRRNPHVELCLYPVPVQGDGAAAQIASGIDFFNSRYKVDVIIVGRGGGSLEDLWAFNEEIVVRSIFRAKVPVISAVGHQTDYTLCDFVSDVRAATPSQAAELAVPDIYELKQNLRQLTLRLKAAAVHSLESKQHRLERCVSNRYLKDPRLFLDDKRLLLDNLYERLLQAERNQRKAKQQLVVQYADKLQLLNPLGVLSRGYSLTRDLKERTIKQIDDVSVGETVRILLSDGSFTAVVDEVLKEGKGYGRNDEKDSV